MKINVVKITLATGVSFGLLWMICSSAVWLMPDLMMQATSSMVHVDLSNIQWSLSLMGFFVGLVCWSLLAAFTAMMVSICYNFLLEPFD